MLSLLPPHKNALHCTNPVLDPVKAVLAHGSKEHGLCCRAQSCSCSPARSLQQQFPDTFTGGRSLSTAQESFKARAVDLRNRPDAPDTVADVSAMIRMAITGKENSPDLYTVMQILGYDRSMARLNAALECCK